ncbi:DNA/RNA non-specific endonuclease (plasmid) [Azospirillum argentinense]|uniref:Endonuclease n=1 Tax=Azospirillum argentinense TaxID=2970906 RepID=A0A4D8Q162_9PROT|nr:DNA/RNA non-specific endonuclease [Azospirillum argentinense]QCO00122.1 DNA/RNA non-specific endonuclease [Azospirillum argentinense]
MSPRTAAVLVLGVLAFAGVVPPAAAASTACPQHFVAGQAPDLTRQSLAAKTRPLCYDGYALLHSGISRTPLWTAEHLTMERLAAARGLKRRNRFHADPNLPADERAELDDYKGSGFDRGHMAPSGDMPTAAAQEESFSLANMIPQSPKMNQLIWEWIESGIRDLAERQGELYVVTGPVFQGQSLQRINGRVLVPSHAFKAVYDPQRRQAAAYLVENVTTKAHRVLSIAELEQLTGVAVFPGLPEAVRAIAMPLPDPKPRRRS